MRPTQDREKSHTQGPRSRIAGRAGFTLIEVLVVIAILAILAATAYPSYLDQVKRGRRADAQTGLMEAAQWLQRYYSAQNSFKDADTHFPDSYKSVPKTGGTKTYSISVTINADQRSYSLKAVPVAADSACGFMTLDDTGRKGVENGTVASCWR